MQGGYYNNDGHNPQKTTERGGLIPITARILDQAQINMDDAIEYNGVILSGICFVGYVEHFQENEANIQFKIWDQTGTINVTFYNKTENEGAPSLSGFNFSNKEEKEIVKVYGTAKVYKREKNIQGAKIIKVKDSNLFYHFLEVVNDWLYLTGKLSKLSENTFDQANQSARNIAMGTYEGAQSYHPQQGDTLGPYEIAQNALGKHRNSHGDLITRDEIRELLKRHIRNDQIEGTISKLLKDGYIVDNGENSYSICI